MKLKTTVLELKKECGGYLGIAQKYGGSPAMWWKIGEKGSESPKARRILGLPPKTVEVEPCSVCGGVHVKKTCTGKNRKRHYVILEYDTEEEKNVMRQLLLHYGNTRKDYSQNIFMELHTIIDFELRAKHEPD